MLERNSGTFCLTTEGPHSPAVFVFWQTLKSSAQRASMRARNPVIFHLIPGGAVLAVHWLGCQCTSLRFAFPAESTNQIFWQDWALHLTKQLTEFTALCLEK